MVALIKRQHFWRDAKSKPFIAGLDDLFDLFKLDGLDIGLRRCLTL
jgi:hypothetical protein